MDDVVWICTTGAYSDYEVHAVFTTEEGASAWVDFMKQIGRDFYAEYEEVPLNPTFELKPPPGLTPWRVIMTREGKALVFHKITAGAQDMDDPAWPNKTAVVDDSRLGVVLWVDMWAKDEMHAIKIANERRAAIIAADRWQTGDVEL